ncbi:hypothetical protein L1887_39910 [Cichorium endivia]|nr:hypothetical protein L1887_39910 [Cichorium endivia]
MGKPETGLFVSDRVLMQGEVSFALSIRSNFKAVSRISPPRLIVASPELEITGAATSDKPLAVGIQSKSHRQPTALRFNIQSTYSFSLIQSHIAHRTQTKKTTTDTAAENLP